MFVCAETVFDKIEDITEKVQSTLNSVEKLQEKLKSLAEEIKTEREEKVRPDVTSLFASCLFCIQQDSDDASTTNRVDSLVADLTTALGISVEEEEGFTERTLDAVQKEFDLAIDALRDTLHMLKQVQSAVKKAIDDGKEDSNVESVTLVTLGQSVVL